MKRLFFSFSILVFLAFLNFAQSPKPTPKTTKKPTVAKTPKPTVAKTPEPPTPVIDEKAELDKALAQTDLNERIKALQKFTADFPQSNELNRALEALVSPRAQLADEKLRNGEIEAGIQLFKDAVNEAPAPISDSLFKLILQFPTNLFYQGQSAAAIEVAQLIEKKSEDNTKQLLSLATFYLGTEKPQEAKRLAEKSILLVGNLPTAYQTLGLANRLDFELEAAAKAYAAALELDSNSVISKRSLAEMKRATGKSEEAVTLYRELLEKDATDAAAQNGLILSLFDAEKREEAEVLLNSSLESNPNNLFLLVGAAYW